MVDNFARAREASERPPEAPKPPPADGKIRIGDREVSADEINAAIAEKAAADSRKLTLPKSAQEYTPTLPADFKPPPGIEYALNPSDPAFLAARQFALECGLTKDQWSRMLGLYASAQVNDLSTIKMARDNEMTKLGATASARLAAIHQYFVATYGKADGNIRMARVLTADDVRIAEKEMSRALNTGGSSFVPSREAPAEGGKVDEAAYSKMSHAERVDYARRFPQPMNGGRRS